jgi:IS605 OrfB family transposase
MERVIKFTIPYDKDIVETIREYNKACNFCLEVGFKNKTFNKNKLHKLTYKKVRKNFKLQSSLVCCARDQASDMLKREKLKKLPIKKEYSTIRYNLRTFSFKPKEIVISLATIRGRKKTKINIPTHFLKYIGGKISCATISFKNGKIEGRFVSGLPTPEKIKVKNILGIDRGILNPVVTSNNQFFNSKEIRRVKGKYAYLRAKFQSKGTPSAKRHLKKISGKERRFMANMNHILSKKVVDMPFEAFALEKLGIRKDKKNGRKFNKKLGIWAFRQFQMFLEYKAESLGKTVVFVDSRHTSQICSKCGHLSKGNRKGTTFRCLKCGFCLHSDLNASRNIAELGKAFFSRLSVNQPIVAPEMVAASHLTC